MFLAFCFSQDDIFSQCVPRSPFNKHLTPICIFPLWFLLELCRISVACQLYVCVTVSLLSTEACYGLFHKALQHLSEGIYPWKSPSTKAAFWTWAIKSPSMTTTMYLQICPRKNIYHAHPRIVGCQYLSVLFQVCHTVSHVSFSAPVKQ